MSTYRCPAALNIAGEHFPCQQMDHMAEGSEGHDGWAHSNREAQAIWCSDIDPVPGMPGWEQFATTTRTTGADQ